MFTAFEPCPFFDDLDDEEEHAMELFRQEVEKMYQEEEEYGATRENGANQ